MQPLHIFLPSVSHTTIAQDSRIPGTHKAVCYGSAGVTLSHEKPRRPACCPLAPDSVPHVPEPRLPLNTAHLDFTQLRPGHREPAAGKSRLRPAAGLAPAGLGPADRRRASPREREGGRQGEPRPAAPAQPQPPRSEDAGPEARRETKRPPSGRMEPPRHFEASAADPPVKLTPPF